ncbi:MAG: hypothetical protein QG579_617 [Patescibacteria group bacterium]|nr:hypothetical protein [Patescibacteria group bacterium]
MTKKTVQTIPEELFYLFEGNWYGKSEPHILSTFEENVLVQPVKFESKLTSFGLHKTKEVTEFVIFNTPHPFGEKEKDKKTVVWRVSGGELMGILGSNQKFYNRLVEPASHKVLYKPGIFHILGLVHQSLDILTRKYQIDKMEKYLPVSEIDRIEPIK